MKALIIIPAFNEESSIESVLQAALIVHPADDILVVNDGSEDATGQKAMNLGVSVLQLPFNLGIGGAVQAGYQYAREHQYDFAVQMDADGQHDPRFLSVLLDPLKKDACDMVIGSRFLPPYFGYQSSIIRRVGIFFFAKLISALICQKITDSTSGFRAVNKKLIWLFSQDYPLDFPEPESIVEAARVKARIREVAVAMHPRLSGHSSIRYFKTLYYMIKVTCAVFLRKIKIQKEIFYDGE